VLPRGCLTGVGGEVLFSKRGHGRQKGLTLPVSWATS